MGRTARASLLRESAVCRLALGIGIGLGATVTVAAAAVLLTGPGGPLLMAVNVDSPEAVERSRPQPIESDRYASFDASSWTMTHTETDDPSSAPEALSRASHIAEPDEEIRWYDGRPIRPAKTMTMVVTAYSPDERSCGKWADGITASGYSVWTNGMNLVAADTSILPFGTLVSVPGYDSGRVVPVLDRGGAIRGKRLDVLYPTHERALEWGVQELEVVIWEYADGKPSDFESRYP